MTVGPTKENQGNALSLTIAQYSTVNFHTAYKMMSHWRVLAGQLDWKNIDLYYSYGFLLFLSFSQFFGTMFFWSSEFGHGPRLLKTSTKIVGFEALKSNDKSIIDENVKNLPSNTFYICFQCQPCV